MNPRTMGHGCAVALTLMCVCAGCSKDAAKPAAGTPAATAPAAGSGEDAGGQNVVAGQIPVSGGQPSFVVLKPSAERELPEPEGSPVMDQISQTFIPAVLLVRIDYPTEFRNNDDTLHNVRVREVKTREGTFNVAIPTGANYVHTFEHEGFYDVGCDIHPGMSATILATSSPYMAISDAAGNFAIADVPPGSYTATVYVGADEIQQPLDVHSGRTELSVKN